MEYVVGATLAELQRAWNGPLPPHYAATIMAGALRGLHAAHEALDSRGESLQIVHRDVSPQNIMVGVDGVPRILDFGVASATQRAQSTRVGTLKGKLAYMAPEQVLQASMDRRMDIYAAGVVLWELLAGRDLFQEENDGATLARVLHGNIVRPSVIHEHVPRALDTVVLRALARDPDRRYGTALEMAQALERVLASHPVPPAKLGRWVAELSETSLAKQDAIREELVGARRSSMGITREIWAPTPVGFRIEAAPSERHLGDIALVLALVFSSSLAGALAMHLAHVWRVFHQ
jgi:serine/threonine-protein kinase